MHPKEDNLRLVSLPSNAPKPTLSSPSSTLAALESFLEAGVPLVILTRRPIHSPGAPLLWWLPAVAPPTHPPCNTRTQRARCRRTCHPGVQHNLVDFDEHLDDVSKDWLNTSLLS